MRREAAPEGAQASTAASSTTPVDTGALRLHASCVQLDGRGVLLLGPSGSGKSDLALRLIDSGALLVADDQLFLERVGDRLLARPVQPLVGLLEVRGVGILRLPCCTLSTLDLVVELDRTGAIPRLPKGQTYALLGLAMPHLRLDPGAPSAAAAVRVALFAERVA
jgi:HPr kinase/phosphorylase